MALRDYSITLRGAFWAIIVDIDGWDYEVIEGGFQTLQAACDRQAELEAEDEAALRQEHSDIMDRLDEVSADARDARAMMEFGR